MRTTLRTCSAFTSALGWWEIASCWWGSKALADRVDLLQAVGGERGLELLLHELDAAGEGLQVGLGLLRRRQAEGEVVQGGKEVLQEPRRGELPQLLLLAHGAAAEVLKVGDGAQVAVVVVGRLLLGGGERLGGRAAGSGAGLSGASVVSGRVMAGAPTQLRLLRLIKFVEQSLHGVPASLVAS